MVKKIHKDSTLEDKTEKVVITLPNSPETISARTESE